MIVELVIVICEMAVFFLVVILWGDLNLPSVIGSGSGQAVYDIKSGWSALDECSGGST